MVVVTQKRSGMKKVVIGLSGGMDSATLLGYLLDQGAEVHCCSFNYGSKHNKWELEAAESIIDYYIERDFPIYWHKYDIEQMFRKASSALLTSGGEIPEGHYKADSMKQTVVPGRNLIFASIMASLAGALSAEEIALGVHAGDHYIYPDCRPEFIKALDQVIFLSSDKTVQVTTPFVYKTKADILLVGYRLNPSVPYPMTRTCYKDQEFACGKCGSCVERLEAFAEHGLDDPINYETK